MMMTRSLYLAVTGTALLCLSACGSDSGPKTVTFSTSPPDTLEASTSVSVNAVVANDDALSGVRWTATCSSDSCGTFTPTTTASGIPTSYAAPDVSEEQTVTLTATSVADPSKSVSVTVTITPPPPGVLADGTYVYHFSGRNDSGALFVAGAFTVEGGVITGGEQDYSDGAGVVTDTLVPENSTLALADDNNIEIVLDTGDTDIGVDGVVTLRGAIVSPTRVLISQFDSAATGTGSLDAQVSADQPAGSYAFVVSGQDASANQLAIGGVLNFDTGALSAADSVFDLNNLGVGTAQAQSFDSGSVSEPDDFGRVTFTLQPAAAANVPAFVLTGYIIDDKRIQLVESQPDDLGADLGGSALGQGDSAGAFADTDLADTIYTHGSLGTDGNGPMVMGGVFGFNADGTLSGNLSVNDITSHVRNDVAAGTYTVDPTGRVTLAGVMATPMNATFNFQLYLDGSGNALIMSLDAQESTAGLAFQQTASSADLLDGSYAVSAQGLTNSSGTPSWGAVGQATVTSAAVDGFTDYTAQDSDPTPAVPLTGAADSQTGLLTLAGLNIQSLDTPEDFDYYPIDDGRTLAIEVAGQQIGVVWLEAVDTGG